MGKTMSMTNDDASSTNMIKTCDNGGEAAWSDLNHDVLLLVMMQLGVVDFLAFSGVCKSWRLLALSNRNKFMATRTPISVYFSNAANEKECYLKDCEGRKFKTTLPHTVGRNYVGLTCGYLILFGEKTRDFWLVNPITRHELHFPDVPFYVFSSLDIIFRAIIVFSPLISRWVFVMLKGYSKDLWFCIAGKREWTHVSTPFGIYDLEAFKGKIYTLHSLCPSYQVRLCEMRLHPEPKLVLLETKNCPKPNFALPKFFSSGEKLYVIDRVSKHTYENIHELDFGEMKWVSCEKTGEEYAIFHSAYTHSLYKKFALSYKREKRRFFYTINWYFFHDWLNVNLLHE